MAEMLSVWSGVKPGSRVRFDSRGWVKEGVVHRTEPAASGAASVLTLCGKTIRPLTGYEDSAWERLGGYRCLRCAQHGAPTPADD